MNNIRTAQTEGRAIYSVKPTKGTGPRQMVMTLSSTGIQNAIAAVKADPSTFVGVDPRVLTAMGLNPKLTTLTGVQAIAKTASTSAEGWVEGVNKINAYLSPTLSAKNIQDIANETLATTKATNAGIEKADAADLAKIATEKEKISALVAKYEKEGDSKTSMQVTMTTGLGEVDEAGLLKKIAEGKVEINATKEGITDANVANATAQLQTQAVIIDKTNYIKSQTTNISKVSDPQTKKYLTYKLNLWKFNNGLSTVKPVIVPIPMTPQSRAAVIAYNLRETAVNATVKADQLAAKQGLTTVTEATTALNSKIAASKTITANQQIIINANKTQLQNAQSQMAENAIRANSYNEYLSTTFENNQIVSTVNAIEMARATGNPIAGTPGHYGSYSAPQQYAATALKGTSTKPPSGIITGLNIGINGDPTISTNLMTKYNKILRQPTLPMLQTIAANLPKPPIQPVTSVRSVVKLTSPPQKVNYGKPPPARVTSPTSIISTPTPAPTLSSLNNLVIQPLEARTTANMSK